jgi:ribosome-binding protein aMBF1 (putative translation factor)
MIRLKVERLRKGWSQQDLAYHARMAVSDVCRIERGWMRPYPGHAARLAAALGLTPDQLVERVDFRTEMVDASA